MITIPSYTPLYRKGDILNCKNCFEDILVPIDSSFKYAINKDTEQNTTTAIALESGNDFFIIKSTNLSEDGDILVNTFDTADNKLEVYSQSDNFALTELTLTNNQCFELYVLSYQGEASDEVFFNKRSLNIKVRFVDLCKCPSNLTKISYLNRGEEYDYYQYFYFSRQPMVLEDEETAFSASGIEQRIFGRLVTSIEMTSKALSISEQDFIEEIINRDNQTKVNGKPYNINSGSIYTFDKAGAKAYIGSVNIIEKSIIMTICD